MGAIRGREWLFCSAEGRFVFQTVFTWPAGRIMQFMLGWLSLSNQLCSPSNQSQMLFSTTSQSFGRKCAVDMLQNEKVIDTHSGCCRIVAVRAEHAPGASYKHLLADGIRAYVLSQKSGSQKLAKCRLSLSLAPRIQPLSAANLIEPTQHRPHSYLTCVSMYPLIRSSNVPPGPTIQSQFKTQSESI
jgi:hypothetical protein